MEGKSAYRYLEALPHQLFVLHGSPHRFDVVEPRQASSASGADRNLHAIYASIAIYDPIIRAVIHGNASWELTRGGEVRVWGSGLRLGSGYIYILPREKFQLLANKIYLVAHEPIKPRRVIRIEPNILKHIPEIIHGLKI